MSLRARLTLLYTSLLGGILLLFGVAVYLIISFLLIAQVDLALLQAYNDFEENSNLKSVVDMDVLTLPTLDLTGNRRIETANQAGDSHHHGDAEDGEEHSQFSPENVP